ncbi:MAG: MAPEG family protein [Steroidobacteraceae bacterium]|nr:MAPEG family protein [Steroidobacteraceae bacterium]
MTLVHVVMMLAVLQYYAFGIAVGAARGRYKVPAPATSGDPAFERVYRVQMNTLEQLMLFLPGLWTFALFVSPTWAAGLGLVYLVGRVIYFVGYTKDAGKRGLGFVIGALPTLVLMVGGLVGAVLAALRA